ncbi:zf-HC2 domain-containing protein [Hamadaea sp. NPDC050747]|uniref:zf-HC2 domain-containing protein n=1 Tax=Hamadaea sp. NPDC050747 TaxID=3155789 RepID=UPI0033E5F6BC
MDAHVADSLGAWALDACDGDEAAAIEAHLARCAPCSAAAWQLRAASAWLGIEHVMEPPPGLRGQILDRARSRRPPVLLRTLVEAYASQVALLDRALRGLNQADWRTPDPRHHDLAGLMVHLTRNDAMLATDLTLPVTKLPELSRRHETAAGAAVHEAWRAQADTLVRGLTSEEDLDRDVSLAGRDGPGRGPLRDALVQRAFETWIHLDDISEQVGRRLSQPPPEQVRRIVSLAVGLLPGALAAHGVDQPGTGRLVLTGPAGGEWELPLGPFTVQADAVTFARLVANRRPPETVASAIEGDHRLAGLVLRVAATLGCD